MKEFTKIIILLLKAVCISGYNFPNVVVRTTTFLKSSIDADSIKESTASASKLQSLKFIQLTKKTEPSLLSEYLMEIGASSVIITDHDVDTENESPIFSEPQPGDDKNSMAAVVCGDAAVGKNLWLRCDVTAFFGASFNVLDIVDNVRTTFDMGVSPRFEVDDVPDLDWVSVVQSSWKPCIIGDFILRLPWHLDEDVAESVSNSRSGNESVEDFVELLLEGGIAFGTGEHPTTQLCLEWISNLMKGEYSNSVIRNFLDYGAGSGILGMAACKLKNNNDIQAVGIELDPDAILIADANSNTNNVSMKSYLPRNLGNDAESASLIMKAMQRSIVETLPEEFDEPYFDACAANILAGPLISLTETIACMLKPGAKLGLSGILEWQGKDVVEAYSEYFYDVKVEKEKGGWVLVSGTRK